MPDRLLHRQLRLQAPPQAGRARRPHPRRRRRPDGRPHVHRRASAGELLPRPPATAATEAVIVDPGDEAERLLEAIDDARRRRSTRSCSRTPTSTTSAPSRRSPARRARRSTARSSRCRSCATSGATSVPADVRAVRELGARAHRRRAASASQLAGLDIDVALHAGPQPRPRHLRDPGDDALFCGDVLFQGSVGRVDLPGGDWPTLLRSIATLLERYRRRHAGPPGPHGRHDARRRARAPTRSSTEPRASVSERSCRRPRGTFDVLPEQAADARCASRRPRARSSSRAGYRPHRDADVRGDRAVRARRRRVDRHRPEGDVHASTTAAGAR